MKIIYSHPWIAAAIVALASLLVAVIAVRVYTQGSGVVMSLLVPTAISFITSRMALLYPPKGGK